MNDEYEVFEILAVKLLFKRIGERMVVLNNERVPNLKRAIESVKYFNLTENLLWKRWNHKCDRLLSESPTKK